MSDWLQPLWNFFTPDGANQSSMDNKQVSKANYNSFGRKSQIYANKILYPTAQKNPTAVYSEVNPTTPVGLVKRTYEQALTNQTQNQDPRTNNQQNNPYTLMDNQIKPTNNTNTTGILALIGAFFVAMIFVSKLKGR